MFEILSDEDHWSVASTATWLRGLLGWSLSRLRPVWQQFPRHRRLSLKQVERRFELPSDVLDALEADLDRVDVEAKSSDFVLPVQNRFSVLKSTVRDTDDDITHTAFDGESVEVFPFPKEQIPVTFWATEGGTPLVLAPHVVAQATERWAGGQSQVDQPA